MPIWERIASSMAPEHWRYVAATFLGAAGIVTWAAGIATQKRLPALGGAESDTCHFTVYEAVLGRHGLSAERSGWAWRYMPFVRQAGQYFGVDPTLLAGMIHTESKWNPYAGSGAGAVGLAQVIPSTAVSWYGRLLQRGQWPFTILSSNNDPAINYLRDKGVEQGLDRTDPYQSIWIAAALMRGLYDDGFGVEGALAAYNAGPTAAKRPRSQWPAQTRAYVPGVLQRQGWYRELEAACA